MALNPMGGTGRVGPGVAGLGVVRQPTSGGGSRPPVVRYTAGNAQLGATVSIFTRDDTTGRAICAYTTAGNNGAMRRRAVAQELASRVSGVSAAQLLDGSKKISSTGLTEGDLTAIIKGAAGRFFNAAKQAGGPDAEIITGESIQRPRSSYCVSS